MVIGKPGLIEPPKMRIIGGSGRGQ